MESHSSDVFRPVARVQARHRPLPLTARMKARQSLKIRELAEALKSAGFLTLDEQAKALGLSRSTAWTIRKASHKASGLSASITRPFSVDHQSYAGRAGAATACPNQDPQIRRGKSCRLIWRQPESTP